MNNYDEFCFEHSSHDQLMLFWINSDENSMCIQVRPHKGRLEICVSLRTDKITSRGDGHNDCEVYGIPFEALENVVDAIRALRKGGGDE